MRTRAPGAGHTLALLALAATVTCTVGDEQEKALGQDAAAQVEREVPMVADDAVNAYVTNLGTALATASDDREFVNNPIRIAPIHCP